jgi:hypothetical protein
MKLTKLDQPILNLSGGRIMEGDGKPLTYKSAIISMCEMHQPSKPGQGEPIKAFDIGIRIYHAESELELTAEDAAFLKQVISNSSVFISVVTGRVNELLEEIK